MCFSPGIPAHCPHPGVSPYSSSRLFVIFGIQSSSGGTGRIGGSGRVCVGGSGIVGWMLGIGAGFGDFGVAAGLVGGVLSGL